MGLLGFRFVGKPFDLIYVHSNISVIQEYGLRSKRFADEFSGLSCGC